MAKKRAHILSTVNAANVSKSGSTYTIKDVCGAVDDIVMNSVLYPADQLAAGVSTMEGRPAPAGHPKNAAGQAISALNGDALLTSYIGAVCVNARHEGGRSLVDIKVNESQAKAHPDGSKLVDRLDAAISGTNSDPIHVSTGLYFEPIATNGEAGGKKYQRIATNLRYDHLAILLNERGAGTPEDGVGMFLNDAGEEEEVERFVLNTEPEDRRSEGLLATAREWLGKLLGNADISFEQIYDGLRAGLPNDRCWLREVFKGYAVWTNPEGQLFRQDYEVAKDGSVSFTGTAQEVTRKVSYQPINNREDDQVKETIIAALNAAGLSGVAAMTDAQLLTAYNALQAKPHLDELAAVNVKLTAANSKIAEHEATALATTNAERDTLAAKLAVNSSLTVEDFKAMPLARLKELDAKAAPVVVGNSKTGKADEFDGYDLNKQGA